MRIHVTQRVAHIDAAPPSLSDLDIDISDAILACEKDGILVDRNTVTLAEHWCYATCFICEADVTQFCSDGDSKFHLESGDTQGLGPCRTMDEIAAQHTFVRLDKEFTDADKELGANPCTPLRVGYGQEFRLIVTAIQVNNTWGFDAGSRAGVIRDGHLRQLRRLVIERLKDPRATKGWRVVDEDDIWELSGVMLTRILPADASAQVLASLIQEAQAALRYTPQVVDHVDVRFDDCTDPT